MKKINFKIYFLLISLMFIAASCGEDFLDRTPKHGYTAGNYYENDDAVIKAIEPLYNYAWSGYNERAIVGMGSFRANDAWSPYLQGEFARFTITGLTDVLINAWSSLYMVVSMSNELLLYGQIRHFQCVGGCEEPGSRRGLPHAWSCLFLLAPRMGRGHPL
jgi:hypothetical protein